MKVFIAIDYGYEHSDILGVFAKREDAEIKAEWEEIWNRNGHHPNAEMLDSGPHDDTTIQEFEVE